MSKEFDYSKMKHATSVNQTDRHVPYNLRQSGPTKVELLISTRVRKSPYWHLSMRAGSVSYTHLTLPTIYSV